MTKPQKKYERHVIMNVNKNDNLLWTPPPIEIIFNIA